MDPPLDNDESTDVKGGGTESIGDTKGSITRGGKAFRDRGGIESRDDGNQRSHRQQSNETSESKVSRTASRFIEVAPRSSRSGYLLQPGHAPPLNTVHLESLLAERQRLSERLKTLEEKFEAIQKTKAYKKGVFSMQRGHLMVELEGLREDKAYLAKRRDKLGQKLLEIHLKRLHLLESEKNTNNEAEAEYLQEPTSQVSF